MIYGMLQGWKRAVHLWDRNYILHCILITLSLFYGPHHHMLTRVIGLEGWDKFIGMIYGHIGVDRIGCNYFQSCPRKPHLYNDLDKPLAYRNNQRIIGNWPCTRPISILSASHHCHFFCTDTTILADSLPFLLKSTQPKHFCPISYFFR